MKSLLMTCFATLLITLAGPANADSDSGTISFSGSITNGSCNMNIGQNPVVFNCIEHAQGKFVVTTADMMKPQSLNGLPMLLKMYWLNPEKSKGIIEVSYL